MHAPAKKPQRSDPLRPRGTVPVIDEPDTELDPADLGTAWGLDCSFEQAEHEGLPHDAQPWQDSRGG